MAIVSQKFQGFRWDREAGKETETENVREYKTVLFWHDAPDLEVFKVRSCFHIWMNVIEPEELMR